MPFALLIIGIVLLVAGVRGTQDTLFTLLKGDFTGDSNFFFWFVSIILIGAIGYVPKLKPVSTAFLVLVVMVLFLTKGKPGASGGGFFQQFTSALGSVNSSSSAASPVQTLAQQSATLKSQAQNLTQALQQNLSQSASVLATDINQ